MTHRYHTGPWAHPPRPADLEPAMRALRWMRAACVVAFAALMVVLVASKALPQAAYDAVNHEVIR